MVKCAAFTQLQRSCQVTTLIAEEDNVLTTHTGVTSLKSDDPGIPSLGGGGTCCVLCIDVNSFQIVQFNSVHGLLQLLLNLEQAIYNGAAIPS